jgi:kynurenine 3-monooxygenase
MTEEVTIVGSGICGCLLGVRLQLKGYHVTIYERRGDYRNTSVTDGISINLALSARGIQGVERVGDPELVQQVLDIMIPMFGRSIHSSTSTDLNFQSYSKDGKNHINSISRNDLNKILLNYAEKIGVKVVFDAKVELVDHRKKFIRVNGENIPFNVCFGTDGAKSITRLSMINMPYFNYSQQYSEHGYKELIMPANEDGGFKLDNSSLHIWPRGTYMLIALPNMDGSFTCTLFMPLTMFENLNDGEKLRAFF